jgi:hypothetical protein
MDNTISLKQVTRYCFAVKIITNTCGLQILRVVDEESKFVQHCYLLWVYTFKMLNKKSVEAGLPPQLQKIRPKRVGTKF